MMNAPSDVRCMSTPAQSRNTSVPRIVSTRLLPISRPLRSPIVTSSTPTTTATDIARLATNPPTARFTSSAWNETTPTSSPRGISPSSSPTRFSTASPIRTTFPPETAEIARPSACLPLKRIIVSGGSR